MLKYCPWPCKDTDSGGRMDRERQWEMVSELFPFSQPVYGNIMGAKFSSHEGGKGLGKQVRVRDRRK